MKAFLAFLWRNSEVLNLLVQATIFAWACRNDASWVFGGSVFYSVLFAALALFRSGQAEYFRNACERHEAIIKSYRDLNAQLTSDRDEWVDIAQGLATGDLEPLKAAIAKREAS